MRKVLSLLAVLVCFVVEISAQTKQISGRVLDKTGQPIPNATITIKGTKTATVADNDGNFTIKVTPGAVLVVSAITFKPFTGKAQNESMVVSLESAENLMNEVIVTAGGIKSKRK